ncbi:MAG: DUF488 domain-containing protein [Thermoplasmata archaeon]
MSEIIVCRVYSCQRERYRVLVDRLWPRGIKKENVKLDFWAREIAPSDSLRKFFSHDPGKWAEFLSKYEIELLHNPAFSEFLNIIKSKKEDIIFLFGSKELTYNNANALKQIIEKIRLSESA